MHKSSLLGLCIVAFAVQLAAADVSLGIGGGNRADFIDLNGQIKLYPAVEPTTSIKLKLSRLEEVDVTGDVKQSVTNFQADSFTWASPELQLIEGVNATAVVMQKIISRQTNTTFGITALAFHSDTTTPYGTGTVNVYNRAVKLTVQVEKWPFLSAFNKLRLTVEVLHIGGEAGYTGQATALPSGETRYAFGPGAVDVQAKSINDGVMTNAPSKVTAIGSVHAVQLTFNSFVSTLVHDSTLHIIKADEEDLSAASTSASMHASACALAIAVAAIFASKRAL